MILTLINETAHIRTKPTESETETKEHCKSELDGLETVHGVKGSTHTPFS